MHTSNHQEKNHPLENQSIEDGGFLFCALYESDEIIYTIDFYPSDTKPDTIDKALDKLFSYTFQRIKEEEGVEIGMV